MAKLFLFAALAVMCGCAGYMPPVSAERGPSAAPSVAIESAWTAREAAPYASNGGWMRAVYTNPVVNGSMFFEVIPSESSDTLSFTEDMRERLVSEDLVCGSVLYDDIDGKSARFLWSTADDARSGAVITTRLLAEKTRVLVCTGSWSLYGAVGSDARAEQQKRSLDRLGELCQVFSQR